MALPLSRRGYARQDRGLSASPGPRYCSRSGVLPQSIDHEPTALAAESDARRKPVESSSTAAVTTRESKVEIRVSTDLSIEINPCLLKGFALRRGAHRLDRRDGAIADAVDRCNTGTPRNAIHMHGARATQRETAAELRSGEAEHI